MSAQPFQIRVAHTADLEAETLAAARALLFEVFDDMTEADWDHSLGGMHSLAVLDGQIVGHASIIQRRIGYQGRPLRAGYVEGVGVRSDCRGSGFGAALMAPLERIITAAYDLGALGASDEAATFYANRGWQRWRGRSYGLTLTGPTRTPEDDDCIFVLPARIPLDPSADLIADWRDDSAW
jgi:aminoglycoside 2'-N-acetyltransferase I